MSISASPGFNSAGVCHARKRRASCTRSVMVFFFTPSRTTVGAVEKHYVTEALELTRGNRTAAAELLGLSRQSLYAKLWRYGLDGSGEAASD